MSDGLLLSSEAAETKQAAAHASSSPTSNAELHLQHSSTESVEPFDTDATDGFLASPSDMVAALGELDLDKCAT